MANSEPDFSLLESIATEQRFGPIDPKNQLRLLLTAAQHVLKEHVDLIGCHLHHRHVPFGTAIRGARQKISSATGEDPTETGGRYDWWPFYFAGCWDRIPLFAMLERSRESSAFAAKSAPDCWLDDDWRSFPERADKSDRFGFRRREGTTSFTRLVVGDPHSPEAVLFFSSRESKVEPKSWEACRQCFIRVGELVLRIVKRFVKNDAAILRYTQLVDNYMRLTPPCAREDLNAIKNWFEWQVHSVTSILPFNDITVRGYVLDYLDPKTDKTSGVPRYRQVDGTDFLDVENSDNHHLVMEAIDVSGTTRYRGATDTPKRRFKDLQALIPDPPRDDRPVREAFWRHSDHWQTKTPCGFHTLAAHAGLVLYAEDVKRLKCDHAKIYDLAYARLEPEIRFMLSVPLLKLYKTRQAKADESEYVWRAIGTISISSPRVSAVDPSEASFLACLLNLGCFRTSGYKPTYSSDNAEHTIAPVNEGITSN